MNKRLVKHLFTGAVFAMLAACASAPRDLNKELENSDYLKDMDTTNYSGEVFNTGGDPIGDGKKEHEIYPGTGEFIDVAAAKKLEKVLTVQGEVTFNFEGEPLQAVVHLILGTILQENYVMAPGVSGKVTFATAKPISKDQVLPILEMLLSWNKAALVEVEGRFHVVPENQAIKGKLTPRVGAVNAKKGFQVLAVPLSFVSPTEMEKILEPYAKEGAVVKADNARNILFLSGTNRELNNYIDTINIFDVDWLAGMSTGIFYLERTDSNDIIVELEALFGEGAETPLAGMFRFLPLERLNAIMVITPQEEYLAQSQKWIERLDRADLEGGANLYVYSVKNIKADDLAGYLNDVFGGGGGSSSRKSNSGKTAPGSNGKEVSSSGAKNSNTTKRRSTSNNDNDIQITSIEESNQLLIKANVAEYDKIISAIKRLDKVPLQVLVELKIIEVSLNDSLEYGMELFFGSAVGEGGEDGGDGGDGGESPETKGYNWFTDGATTGSGGASYNFFGKEAQAKLTALEGAGRVSLVSSPSVMVMNNKNATINVGNQEPITSTSIGGVNNGNNGGNFNNNFPTSNVRYIQTGVQVDITPRVNPGGLVYMEITQDVSEAGEPRNDGGNPPISKRELSTEIAVQSGQTIIMGGLIRDSNKNRRDGVPFLSRIPLIGGAFGKRTNSSSKTELMVLITPTVIENPEQARKATLEYAKKFEGLKPINTNKKDKEEKE
ncbi:type II secretion system secretin GspD [Marinicella rhabdoformis]|uniref:type II secretion system secretin GspD n=1 Tax=Marinicella rhabdoformis TaxID=2580566 RepID=UPI0015D04895|nr:type II secretion system secretin GspD [Marinicella rhabdoformis]